MPRPRLGVILPPLRHATLENENEIKDKGKKKKKVYRTLCCMMFMWWRKFCQRENLPLGPGHDYEHVLLTRPCHVWICCEFINCRFLPEFCVVQRKKKIKKNKKIPVCCLKCRVMWMVFRTGQCLDRVGHPVSQRMPCLHFSTMSCCTPIICP